MVVYQLSWMDCLFPSPCRIFQFLYLKKWMGVGEAIHCSPLCLMRHGTWKEEKCVPQVGHFFTNFSVGYLDSFFENEIEIMSLDYVKAKLKPGWLKMFKTFLGVMVWSMMWASFLSKNKKICNIHLWLQIIKLLWKIKGLFALDRYWQLQYLLEKLSFLSCYRRQASQIIIIKLDHWGWDDMRFTIK